MGVRFVALQERNSWRVVGSHETLGNAISGERGAKNLLRNVGPQRDMVRKYGVTHAVLVWEERDTHARALRLKAGSATEFDYALVPLAMLSGFRRTNGPSTTQIDEWFSRRSTAETALASPTDPVQSIEANEASTRSSRVYRYGSKPTWEVALDAVRDIGRPTTVQEVGDHIVAIVPGFARANIGPDLSALSVNCRSRGNHAANRKPRRTDTGNTYDQLIRIGGGRGVLFELYEPAVHGVWELVDVGEKTLRPRFVRDASGVELEVAREAVSADGFFDPSEDARRRVMASIVQREGQPAFRKALLVAYGRACAISGCSVEALLEAAHVMPYRGVHTNVEGNGLLLRADLHKLFDLHLFCIDPKTRRVRLSSELKGSEYQRYENVALRDPVDPAMRVLDDALVHHMTRCGWTNAGPGGAPLDE